MQLKQRVGALRYAKKHLLKIKRRRAEKKNEEFIWNGASMRYSNCAARRRAIPWRIVGDANETDRNSHKMARRGEFNWNSIEKRSVKGIQLKRRVEALFKEGSKECNWNGAWTRQSKTHEGIQWNRRLDVLFKQ